MKKQYRPGSNSSFTDSDDIEESEFFVSGFSDCEPEYPTDLKDKFKDTLIMKAFSSPEPKESDKRHFVNPEEHEDDFIKDIEPDSIDFFDFPEERKARQEMLVKFLGAAESEALKNNNLKIAHLCTKAIRKIFPWHS